MLGVALGFPLSQPKKKVPSKTNTHTHTTTPDVCLPLVAFQVFQVYLERGRFQGKKR